MGNDGPSDRTGNSKKVYRTPELRSYGDLVAVTRSVNDMGLADGAMGMTNKSGP